MLSLLLLASAEIFWQLEVDAGVPEACGLFVVCFNQNSKSVHTYLCSSVCKACRPPFKTPLLSVIVFKNEI